MDKAQDPALGRTPGQALPIFLIELSGSAKSRQPPTDALSDAEPYIRTG